jgi:S1/P1 Nuclease
MEDYGSATSPARPALMVTFSPCEFGMFVCELICIALKFVTHFIGDITQPLHTSGVAIGGNAFNVTYGNRTTNLHSVSNPAQLVTEYLTFLDLGRCNSVLSSQCDRLFKQHSLPFFLIAWFTNQG